MCVTYTQVEKMALFTIFQTTFFFLQVFMNRFQVLLTQMSYEKEGGRQ